MQNVVQLLGVLFCLICAESQKAGVVLRFNTAEENIFKTASVVFCLTLDFMF